MCTDMHTNPQSFASPSYSCATGSNVRVPAKTCPFTLPNQGMPLFDVPQHALQTNSPNVRAATLTMEKVFLRARTWYPTTRTQTVLPLRIPLLALMSPSNFHKMHTFLHVTNTCHCRVMMAYTNIQRIAFLLHYFFHAKFIPKPPGLLLCLHHHYIRPPASAAPLTRKLPTMCLVPTPARTRDTRLAAAGFRPPLLRYISNLT